MNLVGSSWLPRRATRLVNPSSGIRRCTGQLDPVEREPHLLRSGDREGEFTGWRQGEIHQQDFEIDSEYDYEKLLEPLWLLHAGS